MEKEIKKIKWFVRSSNIDRDECSMEDCKVISFRHSVYGEGLPPKFAVCGGCARKLVENKQASWS